MTKAKSYKATVRFSKNNYLKSSSKTLTVKVKKEKTRINVLSNSVKNNRLKVSVKSQRGYPEGLKLTLKVKDKTYMAKTDKNGRATFALDNFKGKYGCKVTFTGDSKYKSSAASGKVTFK